MAHGVGVYPDSQGGPLMALQPSTAYTSRVALSRGPPPHTRMEHKYHRPSRFFFFSLSLHTSQWAPLFNFSLPSCREHLPFDHELFIAICHRAFLVNARSLRTSAGAFKVVGSQRTHTHTRIMQRRITAIMYSGPPKNFSQRDLFNDLKYFYFFAALMVKWLDERQLIFYFEVSCIISPKL